MVTEDHDMIEAAKTLWQLSNERSDGYLQMGGKKWRVIDVVDFERVGFSENVLTCRIKMMEILEVKDENNMSTSDRRAIERPHPSNRLDD